MTTLNERVKEAIAKYTFDAETADINAVIAYAYYLGRCEVAKEVCDSASEIFKQQTERAEKMRYHNMANEVQGNIKMIYHSDYDQWVKMFANDKTEV